MVKVCESGPRYRGFSKPMEKYERLQRKKDKEYVTNMKLYFKKLEKHI